MTHVLVVDDSAVDRRLAGGLLERSRRASVSYAANGREALEQMAHQLPDIVVTDLQMPEMNGLEFVTAVRARHPLVPVVLMTAQGSEDIACQALQKGAAGYLAKSRLVDELLDTVDSVLSVSRADRRHNRLMECLQEVSWHFVLDNDPTLIPPLVERARQDLTRLNLCDDTGITRLGIAFHESLVNAIDHGNLELNSELREADDGRYRELAVQRRYESPYNQRRVFVTVRMTRAEVTYIVRDEGPGFDPSSLPDPTDPANLDRVYGRGLLLIRTFMDDVRHNATGNEVTMIKRRDNL